MKSRKTVFPGFRAGTIPAYAMADVRKYLISYGLEINLGQLCNLNGLRICDKNGDLLGLGDDDCYDQIIKEDSRGFDFQKQRDAWRESTDFSFVSEFWAVQPADDGGLASESVVDIDASS